MTTTDGTRAPRRVRQAVLARAAGVRADRAGAPPVYPPPEDVFAALHLTPYAATRVVILGQDPYHGPARPRACASRCGRGSRIPPSLVNIHKEMETDLGIPRRPRQPRGVGRQGVLLLNATVTVRAGAAASHQGKGWETFTDEVIRAVGAKPHRGGVHPVGQHARRKRALLRYVAPLVDRVGASIAAVGPQRVLRIQAVLAHQRARSKRPD